jgi:polyhydroxybutyrate depolymerase
MTLRRVATLIVVHTLLVGTSGCTRADLYPILEGEQLDGGTNPDPLTCRSSASVAGDTSHMLRVGTLTRSYVLHIPETYDGAEPSPLIVDFHGIGGTGWGQLASSPYPVVTDPYRVIIAFPDGMTGPIGTGWNMGPCCVADVDDLGFARALVEDVKRVACIDSKRVYAVGVLTGGGMAQHLACKSADLFAAIAPAAFDLLAETVDDCAPSRPSSVISFRGTADSRVPYAGGPSNLIANMPITFLGARTTFGRWAEINGCRGEPSPEDSNGCSSHSDCNAGVAVTLCTKQGGREDPGDANLAWPFLSRYSLP